MLNGVYIFLDDEIDDPLYAEPDPGDLDEGVWEYLSQAVVDAFEGEGPKDGIRTLGELIIGWKSSNKVGLTFVAIVDDTVRGQDVDAYLTQLQRRYLDEVDEPREPDRAGVQDVVIDVIPPWDDGSGD